MKKILFLLLISVACYGQADFPEGINLGGNTATAETSKLVSQQPGTGELNYVNATNLPISTHTQNVLDMKLDISDLPTNLTLYPTTTTSDVGGYSIMVTDIHDFRYNNTAVDITTPTITATDQLVSSLVTDAGVLIGQPGVFNATTFGNIRRLSGSGTATFYFKVFHRDAAGTETLIGTSSNTDPITSSSYLEFAAALLWDDGDFIATDRIVIKYYANRIAGSSDPIYQFQFGGVQPVRTLLPVPFSVVDAGYEVKANKQNSLAVDGTNTKYPTVTAVNTGLASKADDANTLHKTGDETKSGKLNLSNVNLYLVPSPIFSGLTDTGVAGNLNGLYYYSVNYYNALGETDTSGEQSISVTNKQVSVTLPISPNTSVIGRRLYRTVANAFDPVIKYLVADIPNNTATSYVDNIIDGSLGVPVPRVNTTGGQLFNNNDRVGFASGGTTSFGLNSALQSTGYANSSFGFGSLTDNTTGYRNTAGGVFSMYKNTTGYNNTGWGVHSLNDNTTGWDNSAFGFSALISNTTGISNSAFGTFALSQNLTGSNNVAVGPSSLQYNKAGNNTAVGYNSLQNNTTGSGNIGLGYQAGRDNSTGNFNIAIGQGALEKMNDAWFTTAIGFQAGFNATSLAWSNTFIGAESGYNASGGNNVFLGKAAGYYETGSNKLFIDNQQRANESDARISALIYGEFNATVSSQQLAVNGNLKVNGVVKLKNYTVSTLPAGTQGDTAYVTDALTPTYLTAVVGGGSVICPVFHNGTTWVSH